MLYSIRVSCDSQPLFSLWLLGNLQFLLVVAVTHFPHSLLRTRESFLNP